ncbi:phytoene desaturase family protein [Cerasicoccus arenae]|uniref:Phytoene dehydrogenase n=1 Tax=Cerasicoccus arenae TaxID=424488 RepID=A0A8J3GBB9_9BACT|nr:FAD-dependent oxidoreductase [Cerasicoccus arenae]MBK1856904.1 NAD(P)/FAD-dependent oxidoreductase [Cerasicoccus arenae]GHB89764.1 phytoene dehydrogenase [Cerasicoccus arenae]
MTGELNGAHYDCIVIGAGMSGMAAAIRLAMFERRVLVVERHNAAGGLNSFYSFDGRKYDVGLHAMTNYAPPGAKGLPLIKILRQLRLSRDDLDLAEQMGSRIAIPGYSLSFTNDFAVLESEIERAFPSQIDGFRRLVEHLKAFNETALDIQEQSAVAVLSEYLSDPILVNMLMIPVCYYGSARENDLDFSQFVILFKALFLEGFARPYEGVRVIIRALMNRYRELGGERKMKCGVREIITENGHASRVILDDGSEVTADKVISSIGYAETLRLCSDQPGDAGRDNTGALSFVETITVLKQQPSDLGWKDTIVFFNDSETFDYRRPKNLVDDRSGVICFPNNYRYSDGRRLEEGFLRITALANYDRWATLEDTEYQSAKQEWYERLQRRALDFLPPPRVRQKEHTTPPMVAHKAQARFVLTEQTAAQDMFTPLTITKFTGHLGGAVYGAPNKVKSGRTHLDNLYLCGTDQGFLGITGAMLSGISMANLHVLGAGS